MSEIKLQIDQSALICDECGSDDVEVMVRVWCVDTLEGLKLAPTGNDGQIDPDETFCNSCEVRTGQGLGRRLISIR